MIFCLDFNTFGNAFFPLLYSKVTYSTSLRMVHRRYLLLNCVDFHYWLLSLFCCCCCHLGDTFAFILKFTVFSTSFYRIFFPVISCFLLVLHNEEHLQITQILHMKQNRKLTLHASSGPPVHSRPLILANKWLNYYLITVLFGLLIKISNHNCFIHNLHCRHRKDKERISAKES